MTWLIIDGGKCMVDAQNNAWRLNHAGCMHDAAGRGSDQHVLRLQAHRFTTLVMQRYCMCKAEFMETDNHHFVATKTPMRLKPIS